MAKNNMSKIRKLICCYKRTCITIAECFQHAGLDADSQLRLIHLFGAVISGSQVNFSFLLQH